jgi:DNA-binding GntR family transcriptional regulator
MMHHVQMATTRNDSALPPTRAGAVAAQLRELINRGEIAPGSRLRQAEVAERFGVSTTPVREAFVALAREGLVRQDAHRGVVVFMPSVEELAEIYEIRAVLEPLATEIAAKRLGEADLDRLDRILEQMREASPRRYIELNRELHALIYEAAGRPRLGEMIDGLREVAANYISMNVTQYDEQYREQVQQEHEGIVAALRSGSPKQAARVLREHLVHNGRHVARLIEQSQGAAAAS